MLEQARRNVLQPGAVAVPAAATLYCMGLEVLTGRVRGFDMSAVNKFRRAVHCPPVVLRACREAACCCVAV